MSNWQFELDFIDLWASFKEDKLTSSQVGIEVAKKLRTLLPKLRKGLLNQDYIKELDNIAIGFDNIEDMEDFDNVLEQLYDWADTSLPTPKGQMQRNICWIKTRRGM